MSTTLALYQCQDWKVFYHRYSTEMSQNIHQTVGQHSGSTQNNNIKCAAPICCYSLVLIKYAENRAGHT